MTGQVSPIFSHFQAFGLDRDPFPMAPDEEHFFLPKRIEILLTEILHALQVRKGFLCLTGEVGLGKTTLCRRILREVDGQGMATAMIFNTFLQGKALIEAIVEDFGIVTDTTTLSGLMAALNRFLLEKYQAGINCAILIDDAQELSLESLEMVRLISNLEHNAEKLVQILLVGQPELRGKLEDPRLRQLASRIVLHGEISPMDAEETHRYVHYKLSVSGCQGGLDLPMAALRTLHELGQGNPRRINILMDRCLYLAYAEERRGITSAMVRTVAKELRTAPAMGVPVSRPRAWPAFLAGAALSMVLLTGANSLTQGEVAFAPRVEAAPFIQDLPPPPKPALPPPPPPLAEAVPAPLIAFLASNDLERFGEAFHQAWKKDDWEGLAARIHSETGLLLARLPEASVTENRRERPMLRLEDGRHLLFFRPEVDLNAMTYGTAGEGVRRIQARLAELGLYSLPVDGIVGWGMRRALTNFQRNHNLPLNGEPTPETLLLLGLDKPLNQGKAVNG